MELLLFLLPFLRVSAALLLVPLLKQIIPNEIRSSGARSLREGVGGGGGIKDKNVAATSRQVPFCRCQDKVKVMKRWVGGRRQAGRKIAQHLPPFFLY